MNLNKKKVYKVASKHNISLEDAKDFLQARMEWRAEKQENLPFHKWAKMNSNFNEDMEDENGEEFDNLFGKKLRKKLKRFNNKRKRFHKKVLSAIVNPSAMASPSGRSRVQAMVRKMARKVDRCNCGSGVRVKNGGNRPTPSYRPNAIYSRPRTHRFDGFDGAKAKSWIKENKMIVAGGLVAVLFFTPFGKKLIGKL